MNNTFLVLPKSLSAKIVLFLIVTMMCMAALFNIALISIQKKAYRTSYDAHGAILIQLLAHSIGLAVFTENKDEMRAPVSGLLDASYLEARARLTVPCEVIGQDLDGHGAAEARVEGPINLAHSTGAERCGDLVRPESRPGGQLRS